MKAQPVTTTQHTASFGVTGHGAIAGRLFDLLYAHTDIRIVDVPDGGEFLHVDTALALADLIAADPQLTVLFQQRELGGVA